jgi:hypothetical protein
MPKGKTTCCRCGGIGEVNWQVYDWEDWYAGAGNFEWCFEDWHDCHLCNGTGTVSNRKGNKWKRNYGDCWDDDFLLGDVDADGEMPTWHLDNHPLYNSDS